MRNFISLLFLLVMPSVLSAQQVEILLLNEGWEFSKMNENQWHTAEVPGSIQRDLVRHSLLPDPYYGTNEEKVLWVEDKNWNFRKTFIITAAELQYHPTTPIGAIPRNSQQVMHVRETY